MPPSNAPVTLSSEKREPVDKPGSVASNHSSRTVVADRLLRPTRIRRGQRHGIPIWPCSRRGCLAESVTRTRGALLPHPFTLAARSRRPRWAGDRVAVCSLLHYPRARAPQGLPGALSCGARTFLAPEERRKCAALNARLLNRLSWDGRLLSARAQGNRLAWAQGNRLAWAQGTA